jgi:hypothetical protein
LLPVLEGLTDQSQKRISKLAETLKEQLLSVFCPPLKSRHEQSIFDKLALFYVSHSLYD